MSPQTAPRKSVTPGVVRVFISSTFRDMEPEREALMKRAFPRIRQFCRSKGLVAAEIDLRWGIHEQTEIVASCFQEIERCNYFIGILGDVYGTRLEELSHQYVPHETFWNLYPWARARMQSSITELEIEHGVLGEQPCGSHARFYFRKSGRLAPEANRHDNARLATLKDRIRNSGLPYRDGYSTPSELAEWLADELIADLETHYPPEGQLPSPASSQLAHERFAQAISRIFVGRLDDTRRLDESIRRGDRPLLVRGPPGIGKTALVARWVAEHCCNGIGHGAIAERWWRKWMAGGPSKDFPCVVHLSGVEGEAERLTTVLRSISHRLDALANADSPPDETPLSLRCRFAERLQAAARGQPLLLVMDGLDHVDERDLVMGLPWLPTKLPAGVRLVVTANRASVLQDWTKRGWSTLELGELNREELRQYVAEDLNRLYGRSLGPHEESQLLEAKLLRQPRMARSVLEDLRFVGNYASATARVPILARMEEPVALLRSILARWQFDYDATYHGGRGDFVLFALSLLSTARVGLSEIEWRKALGTPEHPLPCAHLSPLINALDLRPMIAAGFSRFHRTSLSPR